MSETSADPPLAQGKDLRARIVAAATELIDSGGCDAATTRAVSARAAVQAPTLYRLFGDMRGLLDAVAEHSLSAYVVEKSLREPHPDPVEDLRDGWDMHVAFGLAHPGLFTIMVGDPYRRSPSPAAETGMEILRLRIKRIALAGRLRVSESRALGLVRSMCIGTVLTLMGVPEEHRDTGLSEAGREAAVAAIISDRVTRPSEVSGLAATLRASLDQTSTLTNGERHLLQELLDRIANAG